MTEEEAAREAWGTPPQQRPAVDSSLAEGAPHPEEGASGSLLELQLEHHILVVRRIAVGIERARHCVWEAAPSLRVAVLAILHD